MEVEKLSGGKDGKVVFEEVLFMDDGKASQLGAPLLKGKSVEGKIVEEGRSKKVTVLRYKSKSRYRKEKGHRQPFVKVKIGKIK